MQHTCTNSLVKYNGCIFQFLLSCNPCKDLHPRPSPEPEPTCVNGDGCYVTAKDGGAECKKGSGFKLSSITIQYTGPTQKGPINVEIKDKNGCKEKYKLDKGIKDGDLLQEFGCGKKLGSTTKVKVGHISEKIHTSCSFPVVQGMPVPLYDPKGDPNPNLFTHSFVTIDSDGNSGGG
eukprot:9797115-Ditylum_brightwellii.AAC.1